MLAWKLIHSTLSCDSERIITPNYYYVKYLTSTKNILLIYQSTRSGMNPSRVFTKIVGVGPDDPKTTDPYLPILMVLHMAMAFNEYYIKFITKAMRTKLKTFQSQLISVIGNPTKKNIFPILYTKFEFGLILNKIK